LYEYQTRNVRPKAKAHEKHPIHGTPFSFSRIAKFTVYKSTIIILTGHKEEYMRLKGNICIYFEYEFYLLDYTIKIKT